MYGIDSNKTKNISYKKIIQVQTGVNILAKIPDAFLFHPRGGGAFGPNNSKQRE